MKRTLAVLFCIFIFTSDVFAANLTLLNTTNYSGMERRLLSAVPGVAGPIVAQDTPSIVATTQPPTTTPAATTLLPEPEEKAACGPTALLALAILPLMLKRKHR